MFLCIYRPLNSNFGEFISVINDILSSVYENKYQGVFVLGDFKLNLLRSNDNNIFDYVNLMFSYSLFPLITKPTRVTETSATLIDHIWSSQLEKIIGNYVIHNDISDHFPVLSQLQIVSIKHESQQIFKRVISATAIDKFNNDLALLDWCQVLSTVNADEAYDIFYDKFYYLFQQHFPKKQINLRRKSEVSPHVTPALKNSIREKHRLERLAKKWPLTYSEVYRKYRNVNFSFKDN